MSIPECQQQVARLKRLFRLLPDLPTLFDEWETLVGTFNWSRKVAHDARLVAAMRTHGVSRLLTLNGIDFARYPGITVLDPATVGAAAPPTP